MIFILAAVLFAAFTINVGVGSLTGAAFLSDVSEMLMLLAATLCFSAGVLRAEFKASKDKQPN